MKVIEPGHMYDLEHFENPSDFQSIYFIYKENEDGELVTVHDGTTNEEVLFVLIDRIKYLNSKFPCLENERALYGLRTALSALNQRTANREARNVEGKPEA